MKVLIIDDTLSMLMTTSAMVKSNGHEVVTARNGADGLALFSRESPDLVLLDVMMPEMDGHQVARRIRADSGDRWTPIIFLTGLVADSDLAKGIAVGGDDYLTKPVSQTVLAAKLHAMQRIADMRNRLVELTGQLEEANRRLLEMVNVDGLTGLLNRRFLDELLAREWSRSARNRTPLSLLMVDVDHFKRYNDTLGHLQGDDCLRNVARACRDTLNRGADAMARYGGEEFVAVLPETPLSGAQTVAERMREQVCSLRLSCAESAAGVAVTVSIGCAAQVAEPGSTPEGLVQAADTMLYRAKDAGRNRVCAAEIEP
ncbi:MAG: diguanylate cyclase [Gammaproteobacteria bacterium]